MIKKIFIKNLLRCCFISILLLLLIINPSSALGIGQETLQITITIRVGDGTGCDFNTIQGAIDEVENTVENITDNVSILVTNQHDWFENISLSNDNTSLFLSISGGFDDCIDNNPDSNYSIIDVSPLQNQQPAIYIENYEDIIIQRFIIKNSTSSGISVSNSDFVNLTKVKIINNTSQLGGGLYATDHSVVGVNDSTIENNYARNGGGISCSNGSRIIVAGSEVRANHTTENETTGFGLGGGIHTEDCTLNIRSSNIQKTYITNNSASMSGGGIHASDGSLVKIDDQINQDTVIIAHNIIERTNPPTTGGFIGGAGIAIEGNDTLLSASKLHLFNNSVNSVSGSGGAISVRNHANFIMSVNKLRNDCGDSSIPDNTMCNQIINNHAGQAGMLYIDQADANITQTYISNNTAGYGNNPVPQLMYIEQGGNVSLSNSIILNNGAATAHTASHLILVNAGQVNLDLNTYINNYPGKLIGNNNAAKIQLTRSIISYYNPSDVLFENLAGASPILFQCLLLNNNDVTAGDDNIMRQIDVAAQFQPTRPYHLNADSIAINRCDNVIIDTGISTPDIDLDSRETENCLACNDAGADKYAVYDLIYKNGFD